MSSATIAKALIQLAIEKGWSVEDTKEGRYRIRNQQREIYVSQKLLDPKSILDVTAKLKKGTVVQERVSDNVIRRRDTFTASATPAPVAPETISPEKVAEKVVETVVTAIPTPKTFPQLLGELRVRDNISKRTLADMLGYVDTAITNWENGHAKPSVESWGKLVEIWPELESVKPEGLKNSSWSKAKERRKEAQEERNRKAALARRSAAGKLGAAARWKKTKDDGGKNSDPTVEPTKSAGRQITSPTSQEHAIAAMMLWRDLAEAQKDKRTYSAWKDLLTRAQSLGLPLEALLAVM